jgi:hypothetical protein
MMKTLKAPLFAAMLAASALVPLAAQPVMAQTQTVENVQFGGQILKINIPRIEVDGGNLTPGEIKDMFSTQNSKRSLELLSRFDAKEVRIASLSYETEIKVEGKSQKTAQTVKNFKLQDVKAGKAALFQMAGGDISFDDGKNSKVTGTYGPLTITEADMAFMMRFYVEAAAGGDNPFKPFFKRGNFDGMELRGTDDVSIKLGKIIYEETRGRLMKKSMADYFAELMAFSAKKDPTPNEIFQIIPFYADVIDSFEGGAAALEGLSIRAPDKKTKKPIDIQIQRIAADGYGNRTYPKFTMQNMVLTAPDGSFKLGEFVWKSMNFDATIKAAQKLTPQTDFKTIDWRDFMPEIGGFSMANLSGDFPDEKNPGQRIALSMGSFDLDLKSYLRGIPTVIGSSLKNLALDISGRTNDKQLKELVALGYKKIDIGYGLNMAWDEPSSTIKIDNLSAEGVDMARIVVKGLLGNAKRDLFAGSQAQMQAAALGLTAKTLTINLEDRGLSGKLIDDQAKKQKKTPATLRQEVGAMANLLLPGLMGGHPAAQKIGAAVQRFVNDPKTLTIDAKAKDSQGLGVLLMVMSASQPQMLLDQIEIDAKAQ